MSQPAMFTETLTITAENPLLHGHVVYGRSLLPGVGYVDLVLQVLARHGHAMPDIELGKLTIFAPLVAGPQERVLTTVEGRPVASGGWRIEVRSRRPQDTSDVLHAVVSARRSPRPTFHRQLTLPISGARDFSPLTEIYTWCREHDLKHSGLMKISGGVHHRADAWIAELELAPEYRASTSAFLFHPALFEAGLLGGGVAIGMLHGDDEGPGLYLPLMFESFRAVAPLGERCFVRVPVDSVHRDEELVRLRVEFYNQAGVQVAEIGQFVGKRVRAATSLDVRDEGASVETTSAPRSLPGPAVGGQSTLEDGGLSSILRGLVAQRLGLAAADIDPNMGYYELGLASADLLHVVTGLEDRLSVSLSPTIMFEYKSIAELVVMLENEHPQSVSALTAADAPSVPLAAVSEPQPISGPEPRSAVPPTSPPVLSPVAAPIAAPANHGGATPSQSFSSLRAGLVADVARLLNVPPSEVDPATELREFGFDATTFSQLSAALEERYGVTLASSFFLEHRTVQAMAEYLAGAQGGGQPTPHQPTAAAPLGSVAPQTEALPGRAPSPSNLPSHPMLGRALRRGDDLEFEAHLNGTEPYLSDHQVHGSRILPGVAHLEMARAAVAASAHADEALGLTLSNVVWLRPAIGGPSGLSLRVVLRGASAGGREFSIENVAENGERTLCSQGHVGHMPRAERLVGLDELRAQCSDLMFSANHLYGLYEDLGLSYGPGQRSVAGLGVGKDPSGRAQVLAELRLPAGAEVADCQLNPSILDGALQATIGLWSTRSDDRSPELALPFALQRAEVVKATPRRAFAWIRHQPGSSVDPSSARLDITVVDELGRVCVELVGLSTRALPAPAVASTASTTRASTQAERRASDDVLGHGAGQPEPVHADTDIAIVGVSGRYPEAADLDEFWANLRAGRDCIREVPAERWDHRDYREFNGSTTSKWGGFLDDIDRFDPLFFQISLLEAEYLDPQERLFLQCAHHALEDAGYTSDRVADRGNVGVFVAVMYQEYQLFGAQAQQRGLPVALWGSASTVANRVSYFFDFHGPSMAVDTMCSSSLTSIHLACEAIKSGQCDAALAGGVNLSPHPNKYLVLSQRNFLSSDGRCRSFGEGGDGYVPGEGVGAVLLKSLARAVADGDHIYGVIKGTALNHGGRTTGYSVPTPVAQGEVIAAALANAGVDPRALSYLEAHGTGTSLGDPIEILGLSKAFDHAGAAPQSCAIGSVKSNIGHCESAAGVAAVTKVLLQLQHEELVPSLHSDALNPHINFGRTPVRVQHEIEPWRRPTVSINGELRTMPRIAGVSSFGGGGSNAHVVISEYVPSASAQAVSSVTDDRPALLVLSAKSEAQLVEVASRLRERLGDLRNEDLHNVAWTLQTGRMALEERVAFAATSIDDARARLAAWISEPRSQGAWVRGTVLPNRKTSTEDTNAAMLAWTQRGAYEGLLHAWAAGATIRWESTYPEGVALRRVRLPGYPFARERCWLDLGTPSVNPTISGGASRPKLDATKSHEMMLLRPSWIAQELENAGSRPSEHHVLVVGWLSTRERDELRNALPEGTVSTFIEPGRGPLDQQYTDSTERVFGVVRGLLARGGLRQPLLVQIVVMHAAGTTIERERLACFGGIAALLKAARLENPLLHGQYIECLDGASVGTVAARLKAEGRSGPEVEVRYRDGQRLVQQLEELGSARPASRPWQEDGVYLITGGAGALGLIVAREIAESVDRATVVLSGRSELSEAQRDELDRLRASGLTADYQRADVADRADVARLFDRIADRHGALTGIIHSAGVLDDSFIIRKTPETLVNVLAPKVAGLVNLDELSRKLPLQTFLCFSSISGAFGNPGQADYAAANAFMDAYAVYRNTLVGAGLRSGTTMSINWPLWDEGGMGTEDAVREQLQSMQLGPLDTRQGIDALRTAFAVDDNGLQGGRLLVICGERSVVIPRLTAREQQTPSVGSTRSTEVTPHEGVAPLQERAVKYFRRMMATALKLSPERINVDTPLERYGMDSVLAVNIISRLEESFGSLSRTLLFEVQTVCELARYFAEGHVAALRGLLGEPAEAPAPATSVTPSVALAPVADTESSAAPTRSRSRARATSGAIAIVGMSGRYSQADNLDAFWDNLREGKDCVTQVPADRWPQTAPGQWWGSFLDGVDEFDPLFFGISPREAALMDPQQRLFLETAWHALEHGGVTQEIIEQRYERRVGVYVGASSQMYRAGDSEPTIAALTSAASYNLIANRVSHFFGLEGPSLAVDSMCTSAAMAIHLACADLQRGEAELAIAGGVNLTIHPDKYISLSEMQLLGSHPGSRSYRDGDGYLPAEGVGAVLLKPLDAAIADGDTIYAVIAGTASVHGGRANGFMTPSHRARVKAMRRALQQAGAEPSSIGYVEDSADGSTLTDEVGIGALREVFRGVEQPVALGTVKSNLGHPEAASGIAQLTKVVLQLQHQQLAPLVNTGAPNPNVDLSGTPLRLCDTLAEWESRSATNPRAAAPRRALINSVAAGGSHVSLVVEAPPASAVQQTGEADTSPQLVVLSANSHDGLGIAASRLHDFLDNHAEVRLADVAYTSQVGRQALSERLAIVATTIGELKQALAAHAGGSAQHRHVAATVCVGGVEDDAGPLVGVFQGPRGEALLDQLIKDRELSQLAELWVHGIDVQWRGLHRGRHTLVPLPLTAFESRAYWIGRPPSRSGPMATPHAAGGEAKGASANGASPHSVSDGQLSSAEQTMAAAWAEVLQVDLELLRPKSSFFSLGGNSLLVTRLINLLHEQVGVELPVQAVFNAPRLTEMAAELERHSPTSGQGKPQVELIIESINLIENMSDEQLEAVATGTVRA